MRRSLLPGSPKRPAIRCRTVGPGTPARFPGGIGVGVGTLIFVVNAVFIWAYQLGCHACRHLCGGGLKQMAKSPVRLWIWTNLTTPLNKHHQLFAWLSLVSIVMTDLYVYLVSSGAFNDPRIF